MATHQVLDVTGEFGWRLYLNAFADLRTRAVQRHVMTRGEFNAMMEDRRVTKYVVVDPERGDRLAGLATMTNVLESVPLISPDYFAARWPERYAEGRIWYVGFVAVEPDYQGTGVFADIVGTMCRQVAAVGGIAALDVCRRAEQVYGLPAAIARLNDTVAVGGEYERLDEQSYWAYVFPETVAPDATSPGPA